MTISGGSTVFYELANAQHASRVSCIYLSQWGTKVLETVMQYSVIVRIFSMTSKRSAAVLEMSCSSPFSTHYNVACSKRSDVGVRHEVRERGKIEREKEPGRSCCSFFLLTYFCAVPTILTPGTG